MSSSAPVRRFDTIHIPLFDPANPPSLVPLEWSESMVRRKADYYLVSVTNVMEDRAGKCTFPPRNFLCETQLTVVRRCGYGYGYIGSRVPLYVAAEWYRPEGDIFRLDLRHVTIAFQKVDPEDEKGEQSCQPPSSSPSC